MRVARHDRATRSRTGQRARKVKGNSSPYPAVLLAALASLAALQRPSEAACTVRLELDPQVSRVVLTSGNLLDPIDPSRGTQLSSPGAFNATVPRGLSGDLYAISQTQPTCPAPADRAGWLASWPSFKLTSISPSTTYSEPIALYPALHLGATRQAGLGGGPKYDYNVSALRLTVDVTGLTPAGAQQQPGAFTGGVRTRLAEGLLASYSFITGLRVDNLQNLTSDVPAVAMSLDVVANNGSHVLVLDVPALELTYQAIGTLSLFGSAYMSYANITLTSRLRATAVLDCAVNCGDYGRCEVVNGAARCVCDCGWVTDASNQCNLPWGYCDATGGILAQQAALPANASSSPPPLAPSSSSSPPPPPPPSTSPLSCTTNSSSVPPVNGSCPAGYDWDEGGVLCGACPAGFSGSGCAFCSTDAACKAQLASSSAQCLLSAAYQPRSAFKSYACEVLDPNMAAIVGTTLDFKCSTTKPAAGSSPGGLAVGAGLVASDTPVNATPYCRLSFRLAGMPRDAAVECTGWACEFATGSSRVSCPLVRCACPKGCSNGVVSEATFTNLRTDVRVGCGAEAGLTAVVGADGASRCSIELSGLPIPDIPVRCRTAECLDPVNGSATVTEAATETKTALAVAPIIAWVPSMVLLAAFTAAAAAVAYFERIAGPGPRPGVGGPAAAVAPAAAAAPAGPVAEGVERPAEGAIEDGRRSSGGGGNGSGDGRGGRAERGVGGGSGGSPRSTAGADGAAYIQPPAPAILPYPPPPPPLPSQKQLQEVEERRPSLPGQPATPAPQDATQPGNAGNDTMASAGSGGSGGSGTTGSGTGSGAGSGSGGVGGAAVGKVSDPAGSRIPGAGSEAGTPSADRPVVQELSWHGLHLSTRPRRSALPPWRLRAAVTLLRDVSGRAVSGEVLGILGPSGSGKTTLLNVLSGLTQPGTHWRLAGSVRLDGRAVAAPRQLAALVGHVPQHDLLARSLTVAECVAASAALRLSWGELTRGRAQVQARVASVLRELGISHLADRVVWPGGGATLSAGGGGGASGGSLSGGERLRVAASLELVSDPLVLLLDEPLSGLDSATARATMAVLRRVAIGGSGGGGGGPGRVVVASLHQPSPALFGCLDAVLLMVGGRVAAAGPPAGLAAVLVAAAVPPPPPGVHLAEHLLDLVSAEADPDLAAKMCEYYQQQQQLAAATGGAKADANGDAGYVEALVRSRGGGSGAAAALRRQAVELGVVTWRSGLDLLRNPTMLALHLLVTGGLGLLVGAVFSNTDLNVSGAQNRVGALFFAVMLLACFATSAVDALYPERAAADRDLLRRSYGIMPYMLAKLVLDAVLLRSLPAAAFAVPFYWLMGLRRQAAAFLTFLGAFVTMSCLSGAACIALSCVCSSPGRAVLLLNLLLLTCALFSGFLANRDAIVVWLRWILYLSPIRFCWEALVINELRPLVLSFSSPDLPQGLPAVKGSLFLSLLGVDSDMLHTDLVVLGCMYAIVAGLAAGLGALRLAALRGRWR